MGQELALSQTNQQMSVSTVSIVIATRNEEKYIKKCLVSIAKQTYPLSLITIVVVDGKSEDKTVEIVKKFSQEYPKINLKLLSNPKRIAPTAFNIGIKATNGDIFIILGAHSTIDKNFVSEGIKILNTMPEVVCVGGPVKSIGQGFIGQTIAMAMSSSFASGSSFRFSKKAKYVDTAGFGAYRRSIIKQVGLFDEKLVRNQDYEFNRRIIDKNKKIYLTPKIQSSYYVRTSIKKLSKQYFGYGFWKVSVMKKNKSFIAPRQLAPLALLATLVVSFILGFAFTIFKALFIVTTLFYLITSLVFALKLTRQAKQVVLLISAFSTMHFSFAVGFLFGLIKSRQS